MANVLLNKMAIDNIITTTDIMKDQEQVFQEGQLIDVNYTSNHLLMPLKHSVILSSSLTDLTI